jgi:hypothetical protein
MPVRKPLKLARLMGSTFPAGAFGEPGALAR